MATNNSINGLPFSSSLLTADEGATTYINLRRTREISGATTLVSADYGKLIVAGGASAYNITLPAVANGKQLEFVFTTTSNALVTLLPASGTIAGQASVVYGSNEGCKLYCDGTNWFILEHRLQPVSLSAFSTTVQTIGAAPPQTIVFNNVTFGSFLNTGTGVYTPLYPGKYRLYSCMSYITGFLTKTVTLHFYKSGASNNRIQVENGITQDWGLALNSSMQLNGSTDTVTVRASATNLQDVELGDGVTYLYATRISNF